MPIAITPKKGLVAQKIAAERPDLKPGQIAKLAGMSPGHVAYALARKSFGRDKPKSRAGA
jgi:hypothetical protein